MCLTNSNQQNSRYDPTAGRRLAPNQYGQNSALEGELGAIKNPRGGYSTEYSATVMDPRLNQGQATNIPTMVQGQRGVQDMIAGGPIGEDQIRTAIMRAIERQQQGQRLPSYDSMMNAETMADWRSRMKGGFQ